MISLHCCFSRVEWLYSKHLQLLKKKQELGTQDCNYCGFSLIQTTSKVYMQVQTYMQPPLLTNCTSTRCFWSPSTCYWEDWIFDHYSQQSSVLVFNPMSAKQILFMLAKTDYSTTCTLQLTNKANRPWHCQVKRHCRTFNNSYLKILILACMYTF